METDEFVLEFNDSSEDERIVSRIYFPSITSFVSCKSLFLNINILLLQEPTAGKSSKIVHPVPVLRANPSLIFLGPGYGNSVLNFQGLENKPLSSDSENNLCHKEGSNEDLHVK